MNKKLRIDMNNGIKTYAHHAVPLSVVLSRKNIYPWYMENFIQLYAVVGSNSTVRLDFMEHYHEYGKAMDVNYFPFDLFNDDRNVIDFIIKCINLRSYVSLYIDKFYIGNESCFRNYHYVRQVMINGYDLENKKLFGAGYSAIDQNGKNVRGVYDKYTEEVFDFESFEKAYEEAKIHYKETAPWAVDSWVILYKPIEFIREYHFNINNFLKSLHDYIFSTTDEGRFVYHNIVNQKPKVGFDVYEALEDALECMLGEWERRVDFRCFHLLVEHKKGLYRRLEYIIKKYEMDESMTSLLEEFNKNVVKRFEALNMNFLKFENSRNLKVIEGLLQSITSAKKDELFLLTKFYSKLKSNLILEVDSI